MQRLPFVVLLVALAGCAAKPAPAPAREDFTERAHAKGVQLYQRHWEYMHVIDPSQGASVSFPLTAETVSGSVAFFAREPMEDWYASWATAHPRAFSATNAQFFDGMHADAALLAFSVKTGGTVHPGYADATEYPGKKLIFSREGQHYDIRPYGDDPRELARMSAADAIVGLKPDAPQSADTEVGRTYVGLTAGGNILLFSSPSATRAAAESALRAFAATGSVMMLDGGPSSQMVFAGRLEVSSRAQPSPLVSFIGVEAGE